VLGDGNIQLRSLLGRLQLDIIQSSKPQALLCPLTLERTESVAIVIHSQLASCRPSVHSGTSPSFRFQRHPLVFPCPHVIHLTPFFSPPFLFLFAPLSLALHIPPLVTTTTMYRWFGSRLSPRSEATPVAVPPPPPPPPPVHCQRCSRAFRDDRAYQQHRQTSDNHHLCRRCGHDHDTHRALQVVSTTPFHLPATSQPPHSG
jgi:hypothetical protein